METIYKTIAVETYESLNDYLDEYTLCGYEAVYVGIINSIQHCYVIVCRAGIELEVTAIPVAEFEEWWKTYGPLPQVGEVAVMTWMDADGYAVALNLVVMSEPDEVVEIEEVIYQ